jgi:hypothetical protein
MNLFRSLSRLFFFCFLCTLFKQVLFAQITPVRFQGNFDLSSEIYSSSGIPERRSREATRAIFTPTITLFDQITLPFEFYISNQDHGYRQPFNQFGVNPHFLGWVTLHAGYFSSQISELTFGDTRLLGGGIDLTPGDFRFSFLYGRSQKAVAVDTVLGIRGMYDRKMFAAKIGYGNPNGWFINLNILHSLDDSSSLRLPAQGTASDSVVSGYLSPPTENAVASITFGMTFLGNHVHIKGEGAVSAFSNDIRSPQLSGTGGLGSLFTPRTSSQLDAAANLSMNIIATSSLSFNLSGKRVGPGFVTLGYAQMPNDLLEWTIGPTIRLFGGTTMLHSAVGMSYNNLRSNRLSTTKRTIVNVGISSQLSQSFGIDAEYMNYGMRSNPRNDTLRIDNISQSVMVTPRFTFNKFGGTNIVALNYSLQRFNDYNVVSENLSTNRTNSGTISWTVIFPSTLSFSTNLMYASTVTSAVSSTIRGITETVGRSFFDNFLSTSLTLGYNSFTIGTTSNQFVGRCNASMNMGKGGTVSLTVSSNKFNYSDPTAGKSYGEYQGSLSYNIHF